MLKSGVAARREEGMTFDPYAVLGVPPTASLQELRLAYEQQLATAHRLGALRNAQEADRAWTLLRDDRRRSLYDRHGITTEVSRRHPYVAQRPVPFRAWSPAESAVLPSAATCRSASTRAVVVVGLGGLLLSGAGWLSVQQSGQEPAATVSGECPPVAGMQGYTFTAPLGTRMVCGDGRPARTVPAAGTTGPAARPSPG